MSTQMTKGDLARRRRREGIRAAYRAVAEAKEGLRALDVAARATGFELKEERHLVLKGRITKE